MPRSAEPRGMMTAMARISGGDTALRRKQADSKQRITSMVKTESYKENLLESLKDPETAAEYLTACLDDGDVDVFLLALRDVAEAQGGIRKLAGRARLNRENLYRMLSGSGNPPLTSLDSVLSSLGLRLAVAVRQ